MGSFIFDYSRFYHAIQNQVLPFRWLSRRQENKQIYCFLVFRFRRTLYADIGGGKVAREVSVHQTCVFIAANVGMYVGVNLV
jgi:hypothetical protein